MKTPALTLILGIFSLISSASVRADTLFAEGRVSGSIFNTSSRQSIEASVNGSGIVRPDGDKGTASGRITGQRSPQSTVMGIYKVLVRATVRYDGGSESISESAVLDVNRRSIVVRGYGRVDLDRPIEPRRNGRQRISGSVTLTISGI